MISNNKYKKYIGAKTYVQSNIELLSSQFALLNKAHTYIQQTRLKIVLKNWFWSSLIPVFFSSQNQTSKLCWSTLSARSCMIVLVEISLDGHLDDALAKIGGITCGNWPVF